MCEALDVAQTKIVKAMARLQAERAGSAMRRGEELCQAALRRQRVLAAQGRHALLCMLRPRPARNAASRSPSASGARPSGRQRLCDGTASSISGKLPQQKSGASLAGGSSTLCVRVEVRRGRKIGVCSGRHDHAATSPRSARAASRKVRRLTHQSGALPACGYDSASRLSESLCGERWDGWRYLLLRLQLHLALAGGREGACQRGEH